MGGDFYLRLAEGDLVAAHSDAPLGPTMTREPSIGMLGYKVARVAHRHSYLRLAEGNLVAAHSDAPLGGTMAGSRASECSATK